jgi:photosystem II stability/assembly factor-like uncharacterized protein
MNLPRSCFAGLCLLSISSVSLSQIVWNKMAVSELSGVLAFNLFTDASGTVALPTNQGYLRAVPSRAAMEMAKPVSIGIPSASFMTLDPSGGVVIGSLDCFLRLNPGSNEWTRYNLPTSGRSVDQVGFGKDKAIYVLATGSLWKSIDNGATFAVLRSDAGRFAFNSSGHLFVGVSGVNRVARSMDGGATWEYLPNGFRSMATSVSSIVIDRNDNLYASVTTTPGWVVVPSPSDVFTSSNNGDLWQVTNSPLIGPLLVTADGDLIVSGFGQMVLRTSGGERTTYPLPDSTGSLFYDTASRALFYATARGYLHTSTNKGATWRVYSNTAPAMAMSSFVIDAAGKAYVGTSSGAYCSTNSGLSWSPISPASTGVAPSIAGGYALVVGDSGYNYLASSSGINRTRDFLVWEKCSNMWYDGSVIRRMFTLTSTLCFFNEKNSSLYISGNGFRTYDSTLIPFKLLGLTRNALGVFFASARNGIYRSNNNFASWEKVYEAPAGMIIDLDKIIFDAGGYGYAVSYSTPGLFRSSDHGQHWERIFDARLISVGGIISDKGGRLYAVTPMDAYTSSDHGSTWTDVNNGLPTWKKSIAIDSSGYVYISAEEDSKTAVYWTGPAQNPLLLPSTPACIRPVHGDSLVMINPTLLWSVASRAMKYELQIAGDSLFATVVYNNALCRDTTLQIPTLAHKNTYFWRVRGLNDLGAGAFSPVARFRVYIASPQEVPQLIAPLPGSVCSGNPALTWNPVPGAYCYHLQISDDSLFRWYIMNDSSSIVNAHYEFTKWSKSLMYYWRVRARNSVGATPFSSPRSFRVVVSTAEDRALHGPLEFRLDQNYPNPFNPATTIRFTVARPGFLTLKIYDLLGAELETIAAGFFGAGEFTVRWYPKNLSSGVYLCRMQSGTFVKTRKIQLIR